MYSVKTISKRYDIPRYEGWEEILEPLVRKITGTEQGKVRTGVNFENDIFQMKMYISGICNCAYGKAYIDFENTHFHNSNCFHKGLLEINEAFKGHKLYESSLKLKTERINMEMKLCRMYKIPYKGGEYLESICTCDFANQWKELKIQHEENCKFCLPNFLYKPDDVRIWWKKKFFRDSYCNIQITKESFKTIIGSCLNSIRTLKPTLISSYLES